MNFVVQVHTYCSYYIESAQMKYINKKNTITLSTKLLEKEIPASESETSVV